MPRPPRIALWPRFWPLSRDQGARPTREVNALLSQWPSSGRWAIRMAAVSGPTPGTVRYNAARWASSPSEKHGWRVFGGMMGPVQ